MKNILLRFVCPMVVALALLAGSGCTCGAVAKRTAADVRSRAVTTYCWTGQVNWVQGEAHWPVQVSIMKDWVPLSSQLVTSSEPFTLCADLAPGDYFIHSEVREKSVKATHWGAFGPRLQVAESGVTTVTTEQEIVHKKKIRALSPERYEVVREKRPTLTWEPFPGAVRYQVGWFEKNPADDAVIKTEQRLFTDTASYTFAEDVVPGRTYEWFVMAYLDDGDHVAYYSSMYFKTPGE